MPITCPTSPGLCEGLVVLSSGRTVLGSARFIVRGGRSTEIRVRLSRSALKRVRARTVRQARVSVFSRDLQGDATESARTLSIR